jgi:hypothetical protein
VSLWVGDIEREEERDARIGIDESVCTGACCACACADVRVCGWGAGVPQGDNSFPAELHKIALPPITDCLQGLLMVVPLQLLSYHLAVVRGYNVRREHPHTMHTAVSACSCGFMFVCVCAYGLAHVCECACWSCSLLQCTSSVRLYDTLCVCVCVCV